jgi:hypothetical protein
VNIRESRQPAQPLAEPRMQQTPHSQARDKGPNGKDATREKKRAQELEKEKEKEKERDRNR